MTKYNARWDAHTDKTARRNAHWAASDRGWLFVHGEEVSVGHYLDYGAEHYRSGHEYCREGHCECEVSQPGKVHAVRVATRESHYFPDVFAAMRWIEAARPEIASERIQRSGPVFAQPAAPSIVHAETAYGRTETLSFGIKYF